MKKFLLAAVVTLMTIPAFADTPVVGDDQDTVAQQEQQQMMDQNMTPANPQAEAEALPPRYPRPRPFMWTCFARDYFGRQFWGRSWNRGFAQRLALRSCMRSSFPVPIRSCRLIGCRPAWY